MSISSATEYHLLPVSISATELANYASRYPCLRCAWIKMHVKDLPYQSFPAIFSTIDSFTKNSIKAYFDTHKKLPDWLSDLGEIHSFIKPPGWRKFFRIDDNTEVSVRGEADAIFKLNDGAYHIADYKTSKYNPERTYALDSYEVQLNAYAWIAELAGFSPVNKLSLIFMEPDNSRESVENVNSFSSQGLNLGFVARIVPVKRHPENLIPPLLEKVRAVYEMKTPPASRGRCRECRNLDNLIVRIATGID